MLKIYRQMSPADRRGMVAGLAIMAMGYGLMVLILSLAKGAGQ